MQRKVIVYIACSVDGYIAGPNDDLSFLSIVEQEGEDYGYAAFIQNIDTMIVGRKTYEKVQSMGLEYPPAGKMLYVITRSPKPDSGHVKFYSGGLAALVQTLRSEPGMHIYCDGGAEIVNQLLKLNLVDELIISVIPTLLGSGTQLFDSGLQEQKLTLFSSKQFDKGLVQLHYKCKHDAAL